MDDKIDENKASIKNIKITPSSQLTKKKRKRSKK